METVAIVRDVSDLYRAADHPVVVVADVCGNGLARFSEVVEPGYGTITVP